ncbi:glycosyltransferase family 39 protein [Candidatus Woesebacteria bacterium]|nr:glycosyltransferase family 39 protein [Candidatus Woesebacteria bacterium]
MFRDIRSIVAKNWPAVLIIVCAALLRFYNIAGYVTFLGDQGRDALILKHIVTLKHLPAIGAPSSVGQIYLGPFYYYLIAPFLLLFRFDPIGPAVGVALLSIVGTIALYWIMKKECGVKTALISILFISFSSSLIDLSRFSWNPNLLPYFSFFTLYFFDKLLKGKEKLYWHAILCGAFLSFSIQLHYLAVLLLVPMMVMLIINVLNSNFYTRGKKNLMKWVYALLSFCFFSSPLIVFDLRHDFLNTRNFMALIQGGKVIGNSSYASRVIETASALVNFTFRLPLDARLNMLLVLFVACGGVYIAWKKKNTFMVLISANIVAYLFGFSLLNSPRLIHYFGPAYLSLFVVVAYFIAQIKNTRAVVLITAWTMLFFIIAHWRYYYFNMPPSNQIVYAKEVADSFGEHINAQPIQIVPLPFTETDGHFRYFLDLAGYNVLPDNSSDQAEELFVMCFSQDCNPTGDPHWQIAAFYNKQLVDSWRVKNVTIYKFIHGKET